MSTVSNKIRGWSSVVWVFLRHPLPDRPTYIRKTEERWYDNDRLGVVSEVERRWCCECKSEMGYYWGIDGKLAWRCQKCGHEEKMRK